MFDESTIPSDPTFRYLWTSIINILCWSGGRSAKDPPKMLIPTFVPFEADPVFDCVNISIPRKVVKKKKRKGKSKSTNGGQFTGPSVKQNVRYEPKATTSAPMKGTTYVGYTSQSTPMLKTTGNSSKKDNLSMSNSFSALNEEEEEDE
ncbi:hypothetical protein Tco_1448555 [Tanacetum coccineum]